MADEPIPQNIYNTLFKLIPNYMSVAETEVIVEPEGAPPPNSLKKMIKVGNKLTVNETFINKVAEGVAEAKGADTQEIKLRKKLTSDDIDKINDYLKIPSSGELPIKRQAAARQARQARHEGQISVRKESGQTPPAGPTQQSRGVVRAGGGGGKTHKNIPVGLINSKKNQPKNSLKKNNQKSNIKTKKN